MLRHAARVLLLDAADRLLALLARDPSGGEPFWLMPGGGLLRGEDHATAARREVFEETGIAFVLGPAVWTRRHRYPWRGEICEQHEVFFVARALHTRLAPTHPDTYVLDQRWWSLPELEQSRETFAPRALARLLPPLLREEYANPPLDCGI